LALLGSVSEFQIKNAIVITEGAPTWFAAPRMARASCLEGRFDAQQSCRIVTQNHLALPMRKRRNGLDKFDRPRDRHALRKIGASDDVVDADQADEVAHDYWVQRGFSLTGTVSLTPQAVNSKVLADISARSMIFAVLRRPEATNFKAVPTLCPNAGRAKSTVRSQNRCCRKNQAAWYVEIFGASVAADTIARGAP
jgi:hypothetical protein